MRDITYDPDSPLFMGPAASRTRWRNADRPLPELDWFEHRHHRIRVPKALIGELEGIWNELRHHLEILWQDEVETGRWGAVAVATYPDGMALDFMDDRVPEPDTCLNNRLKSNRETVLEFLADKVRIRRLPIDPLRTTAPDRDCVTVKTPTWRIRGGHLFYDPTHIRTARGLAGLLASGDQQMRILSEDHVNELDRESTERAVEAHIGDELKGSVLADNEEVFERIRQMILDHVAHWCPECHDLDVTAGQVLSELGCQRCYGCEGWFKPRTDREKAAQFLCKNCLDEDVDPSAATERQRERIKQRLRRGQEAFEAPLSAPCAELVAILLAPGTDTPEFGAHQQEREASYLYGMLMTVMNNREDTE